MVKLRISQIGPTTEEGFKSRTPSPRKLVPIRFLLESSASLSFKSTYSNSSGKFKDSVNFTNKVAELAEAEDHHPEIVLEWGNVTVSWWSHKIKGLHKNDFICASKTDDLFQESN